MTGPAAKYQGVRTEEAPLQFAPSRAIEMGSLRSGPRIVVLTTPPVSRAQVPFPSPALAAEMQREVDAANAAGHAFLKMACALAGVVVGAVGATLVKTTLMANLVLFGFTIGGLMVGCIIDQIRR